MLKHTDVHICAMEGIEVRGHSLVYVLHVYLIGGRIPVQDCAHQISWPTGFGELPCACLLYLAGVLGMQKWALRQPALQVV